MNRWIALALLFLSAPAWAADGDRVSARDENTDTYRKRVAYLCDGKISTDTTCTELDFRTKDLNMASWYIVQIDTTTAADATACTGSLTFRNYDVAGGVGSTPLKPTITTLTIGATESAHIQGPLLRYADVGLTLGGCTAGHANLRVTINAYFQNH